VRLLGGKSGRDVDKIRECHRLGCTIEELQIGDSNKNDTVLYQLLSGCPSYLHLIAMGDIVDAGSHAVAICRVETMYSMSATTTTSSSSSALEKDTPSSSSSFEHLTTGTLRHLGIINEQGRVKTGCE
jgi:hypothetical protein